MASRAKMRKIAAYGRNVGMGKPENREEMKSVLADVRNPTTRQQLRRRLTVGVRQQP